ncbi:MAG: hypothetical protein LJE59_09625 [Chromatiaceae bacterium]|nr:hypothetical protein [Chromatiaceae bacterium]
MKTIKLLKKAEEILSAEKSEQRKKKKYLKEILGKLKKRKHRLQDKLKTEKKPEELERLRTDLAIIRAQRKKGVQALKDLKKKPEAEAPGKDPANPAEAESPGGD